MKSTPENKVKARLKIFLDSIPGLHYYPAVAGPYSVSGVSDTIGCYKGLFFALEVKAPGRRKENRRGATAHQEIFINNVKAAGGFAMVFDGEEDDWEILTQWVEEN